MQEAPVDDDWAPLAAEPRILHPGERVAPVENQAFAAQQQHRAAAAAATAAFAALQRRLAAAQPARSLLAAARQRDCEAAQVTRAVAARAVAQVMPAAPTAVVALEEHPRMPAAGGDPREQEPWFRGLPASEQQRLHRHWQHRRELVDSQPAWQRRLQWQRFAAAVVLFASLVVLGTGAVWVATLGAGIVCGLCWRHLSADRYRDPVVAVALLFAGHLVAMVGSGADGLPPGLFLDVLLLTAMAALVGFAGEIRRTGGFDVS